MQINDEINRSNALNVIDIRIGIVHNDCIIISAREDFCAIIIEAQTENIAKMLIFHCLWCTNS